MSDRHAGRLPTWLPPAFFGRHSLRMVGHPAVVGRPPAICGRVLIAIIFQTRVVTHTGIIVCDTRAALDSMAH